MIACLASLLALMLLLAAWHVFWAPFLLLGMALGLILEALGISWAWAGSRTGPGPLNGLECTPAWAGALFYQDPGIQVTAKVEGDLLCLDLIINLTTAGYKDLSTQNCMIQDSGR